MPTYGVRRPTINRLRPFWRRVAEVGLGTGKRRRLVRALGRAVHRAFRDADRQALEQIYRRLFEIEAPISARLARTLRLIDRIGSRTAGKLRVDGTSGLVIPQWRALYPPSGEVPREVLTRHTLVLGETGSGKTASCMLPVVVALARTPAATLGVVARFVRRITPRARTGSVSTSTHGLGDSVSRCPTYSELFGGLTG